MQQLWDKLRRKVNDVQGRLPAGAGTSVVNDDFGDVLGVFMLWEVIRTLIVNWKIRLRFLRTSY